MIGRRPPARIEVEMPSAGVAAVRVTFPGGGTGRPAPADRLDLVLGLIAQGIHGTDEREVRGLADRIRELATAIAQSPDGHVPPGTIHVIARGGAPVDMLLVPWSGQRGARRITMDLVRSAVGPVPVARKPPAASSLVLAGLMASEWEAQQGGAEHRLALALALEGLINWYREAHRLTPVRDAVEAARTHAADRMRAAGHDLPPLLAGAPA
jgi:hypothetical protein